MIDTPIAEMGFVGAAVGAAMTGLRPIVEIMFVDLIGVCYDQIVNQAAKMHYMMGGQVRLPLVDSHRLRQPRRQAHLRRRRRGAALADALLRPGARPRPEGRRARAPPTTRRACSSSAIRDDGPVVVMEHKFLGFAAKGDVPEDAYTLPDRQGGGGPHGHAT